MHNEYDKIEVLDGLSGVRAKLAMYIGGTGVGEDGTPPRALIQMLQETISNSLDEAISGYGDEITITVHDDNSVSVLDHGRGIPAGVDLQDAINAFTKTHASGKFSAGAYTTGTTGMHGIGMKAVNAASSFMRVESIREDGSAFLLEFECGELTLKRYGDVIREELLDEIGSHGTLITFMPDTGPVSDTITKPVLESNEWDIDEVKSRCEIAAFLTPGVTITLNARGESTQWCYPGGLAEWFSEGREAVSVAGTANVDGHEIQVELVVSDGSGSIVSFANGVATKDGGYHEAGLRASLPAAFSTFANRKFVSADVLSALDMAVHVKVPADIIEFEGQTKEKLGTSRARQAVSDIVKGKFVDALFDNSSFAKKLIESIDAAKSDREAIVKARELAKKAREATRGVDRLSVSSKLKTASSRNPAEKELIITEGDSASGIGRDPKTQAIMPLRGKIKNVYEIPLAEALSNKEVSTLISVLGAGVSKDFDPKKSQYGQVLIACDQDSDGFHIRTLLLGMFFKLCPGLIENGMLYVVQSPLYKAIKYVNGQQHSIMIYSESEMVDRRNELAGYEIRRFKGLGEMSPEESHAAIADKETRHLVKITVDDARHASTVLKRLLGNDLDGRKQWLAQEVRF
jgi:DNA gyrase, B subunit